MTATHPLSNGAIGIDYTAAWEQGGGIGRYVRELVAALGEYDVKTRYRLFVAGATSDQLPPPHQQLPPNYTWRPTRIHNRWWARWWHRARLPYPRIEAFTGPLALYHATDFVLPPTHSSTKTLLTVHDLSYIKSPETASPRLRRYLNAVVPRSVARANHILADSESTKSDLMAIYHVPDEKITVLLPGVNARFRRVQDDHALAGVREKYHMGDWPYLFTVGTVQPRKNYVRLFEALEQLLPQFPDLHLVIAGGKGWLDNPIYDAIRNPTLQERVHFIGFADDADLPALYTMAQCVPFISLYEGFGLPVLEAMACGTPVVSSTISSTPEAAGGASLEVDPLDVAGMAEAIGRVLRDATLRQWLIERGYQQAATFTWHRTARQLHAIYAQLLNGVIPEQPSD